VTDSSLVRIDPETNRIAAVTDVGRGPKAVAVGGKTVWVYNVHEGIVFAVDSETSEIGRTTRLAASPPPSMTFFSGPVLAADAGGAWALGSSGQSGVLTRVTLGNAYKPQYALPINPIAIAHGHGALWILAGGSFTSSDTKSLLLQVDPTTGEIVKQVAQDGDGVAAGEGAVWVTDAASARLFQIDPATSAVTRRVDLGPVESGEPTAASGFVWVATKGLQRVDPRTLRVTKAIPISGSGAGYVADGFDVAFGHGSLWVHTFRGGMLWRIDPRTGKTLATIRLRPESTSLNAASSSIAAGAGGVWVAVSG
jgi:glutamine cyclotransferase